MVNFGLVAAEIGPVVWRTLANFNGIRVLAVLLHGSQVVSVSQTAALNRGRHLCSAGRPSRWALAHILVTVTRDRDSDSKDCYVLVVLFFIFLFFPSTKFSTSLGRFLRTFTTRRSMC